MYIEKDMAIAKLTNLEVTNPFATITDAKRTLADMQVADVTPIVHGKWVKEEGSYCVDGGITYYDFFCSVCGETMTSFLGESDYCPWCGAKMDKE